MAFLGFKTTSAAQKVIQHFNGSFMGTHKLKVEAALAIDEATKQYKEKQEKLQRKRELFEQGEAPRTANGSRKRGRDTEEEETPSVIPKPNGSASAKKKPTSEAPKKSELVELFVDSRINAGPTFASELLAPTIATAIDPKAKEDEELMRKEKEAEALAKQQKLGEVSDNDFLAALQSGSAQSANEVVALNDNSNQKDDLKDDEHQPLEGEALAAETRRVRVQNLPYIVSESEVKNFFSSAIGSLESVHLPLTRDTKQSKGSAYLRFHSGNNAVKALSLNGTVCMGRLIRVSAANLNPKDVAQAADDPTSAEAEGDAETKKTFKAKRAMEKKAAEVRDKTSLSWNPLYMASDTAVATIAKRMNVDDSELVSVNAPGAAVRAAVAEAVLTSEAKRILGDDGIDFSRLQEGSNSLHRNRSNTTILVKNLPKNCPMNELSQLFKKHGPLEAVAMPSDPTFVLFAFTHSQDARVAFQRLAYRKFHSSPLFLEWAPVGSLKDDDSEVVDEGKTAINTAVEDQPAETSTFTAYLTNIPFNVTEESLRLFLQDVAPRLCKEGALQRIDWLPDKGRAYVTVGDDATLRYLVSKAQGKSLEGRAIGCQVSNATAAHGAPRLCLRHPA